MRLALILSLTMLLLGCDQIQLRVGSSETETEIEIDSLKWEFTAGYYDPDEGVQGWLLNKETGELLSCSEVYNPIANEFLRECNPIDMRPAPDDYNVVPKSPRTAEEDAYRQKLLEEILGDGQPTNESGVPDFSL